VAAAAAAAEGVLLGLENPLTVNRGIYYSQDAGQTWRYASVKDGSSVVSPSSVTSVVYNAAAGKFFAAVRYHGIYSSSDGINWARLADANQPGPGVSTGNCPAVTASPSSCPIYRAEIAVVPGRNEMYTWVVALDSTGLEVDGGLWQSLNGGTAAWTSIPDGGITDCGDPGLGGCGVQQGTYNLEIAALPDGSGTDLYAGAINIYKCRITSPTSPGACSFLNLTHVYGCMSIANVHPDQHHLAGVIASGKQLMYFVNDGGVYRALDGYTGLLSGTCGVPNQFDDLNGTLGSMTQFVSFSMHPTDANTILGGTQDNGSPATGTATTSTSWANVLGGDGGFNAISPTVTTDWFTANPDLPPNSLNINYCGSGIACTNNAFQPVVTSAQVSGDDGAFYFPYILDPQASTQLIVGTCRVWRGGPATSSGGTYTALSNNFDTGVGGSGGTCYGSEVNLVRSLAAGGPKDGNGFSKVIYAGTDGSGAGTNPAGGRVFVTTNAGTSLMADRTGTINPGQFPVSSIAIDPSDATGQTAYVTIMGFHVGHVFKTTNAGLTWTDFSGTSPNNIPDAPADAVVVDASAGMVYVGTDVGVFVSSTSAASWTEAGGVGGKYIWGYLPNVPVTALQIFHSGGKKLLRASTYGRGIWQFDLLAPATPDYHIAIANPTLTIFPSQSVVFNATLSVMNGYTSAVELNCTAGDTPPPLSCGPPVNLPQPGNFTVSASAGGAAQDYLFNIHGVGADAATITHDAPVTLHVVDFALSAPSPASVTMAQGSTSAGVAFVVSGAGVFQRDCDAGLSDERNAGSGKLQLFAFGVSIGVTGDDYADGDDRNHDFRDDFWCAGSEDSNRDSDCDSACAGLHAEHQQLSAISTRESGGNLEWIASCTERLRQRRQSKLRDRGTADVHDCARIGNAHGGRHAVHGHHAERGGTELQLRRQWSEHRCGACGPCCSSDFQFSIHDNSCTQWRDADREGGADGQLQRGCEPGGCGYVRDSGKFCMHGAASWGVVLQSDDSRGNEWGADGDGGDQHGGHGNSTDSTECAESGFGVTPLALVANRGHGNRRIGAEAVREKKNECRAGERAGVCIGDDCDFVRRGRKQRRRWWRRRCGGRERQPA
jgi:hypothetical protein